jgi:hypothetical protein
MLIQPRALLPNYSRSNYSKHQMAHQICPLQHRRCCFCRHRGRRPRRRAAAAAALTTTENQVSLQQRCDFGLGKLHRRSFYSKREFLKLRCGCEKVILGGVLFCGGQRGFSPESITDFITLGLQTPTRYLLAWCLQTVYAHTAHSA